VVLKPKTEFVSAHAWVSGKTWQNPAAIELDLGAGKTEFVEFALTAADEKVRGRPK
jgi:hypothetical protein